MNKLSSLKQISGYRPKALSPEAHIAIQKRLNLKHFKLNNDQTYLKSQFLFDKQLQSAIVDKMTTIGAIADNMDHHPEWTLSKGKLEIGLSTHECEGKVSIKDYILASWIEQIWHQQPLEERLMEKWNKNDLNLDELK